MSVCLDTHLRYVCITCLDVVSVFHVCIPCHLRHVCFGCLNVLNVLMSRLYCISVLHVCIAYLYCMSVLHVIPLSVLDVLIHKVGARRGGGLGSRPKKMYGERLGDGVEYHLMKPTPRR